MFSTSCTTTALESGTPVLVISAVMLVIPVNSSDPVPTHSCDPPRPFSTVIAPLVARRWSPRTFDRVAARFPALHLLRRCARLPVSHLLLAIAGEYMGTLDRLC